MADLKLTDDWVTGIYQLEEADLVLGGPDGIDNRQAKELGARTNYLRKHGIAQWAAAIAYDVDCYVKHNGGLWRSKRVCLGKEPGKSADDWEVLTLPLSQLDARYHAKDGQLAWAKVTATPTTLAGYGITDSLKLDALDKRYHPYNGAYKWANLADKPTTLAGYGITDQPWALPLSALSAAVGKKADSAHVDQVAAEISARCLTIADAAKTYVSMAEAKQRFAKGIQVFTEDGEFVVPPGIYLVFVTLVGGGGGGGGGGQDTRNVFVPGGGGGAGEFKYRIAVPVTPGQRIKVTVGKAGQGGKTILAPQNKPLPDGHAGGISSFGQFVSVSGGGAGNGGFTGSGSVGGAGGVGYPGGDSGEYTATPNNSYVRGGGGGSSPLGGGGPSVHGYQSRAGGGYGAGGGGGALYYLKGEDADGGPGSQGIVIVEW